MDFGTRVTGSLLNQRVQVVGVTPGSILNTFEWDPRNGATIEIVDSNDAIVDVTLAGGYTPVDGDTLFVRVDGGTSVPYNHRTFGRFSWAPERNADQPNQELFHGRDLNRVIQYIDGQWKSFPAHGPSYRDTMRSRSPINHGPFLNTSGEQYRIGSMVRLRGNILVVGERVGVGGFSAKFAQNAGPDNVVNAQFNASVVAGLGWGGSSSHVFTVNGFSQGDATTNRVYRSVNDGETFVSITLDTAADTFLPRLERSNLGGPYIMEVDGRLFIWNSGTAEYDQGPDIPGNVQDFASNDTDTVYGLNTAGDVHVSVAGGAWSLDQSVTFVAKALDVNEHEWVCVVGGDTAENTSRVKFAGSWLSEQAESLEHFCCVRWTGEGNLLGIRQVLGGTDEYEELVFSSDLGETWVRTGVYFYTETDWSALSGGTIPQLNKSRDSDLEDDRGFVYSRVFNTQPHVVDNGWVFGATEINVQDL